MRIATWNVNGLRARQDFLLRWLRKREPDLVALQELKLPDAQFPHDLFAQAGYHALVHGQKSWNGVAVLAKKPLTPVHVGLPGQEEGAARLVCAEVEGLVFASLYCPNGKHIGYDDFPRKLAWYDALAEHIAAAHRPDARLVLGGDFNVCPSALDSWDEAALAEPPLDEAVPESVVTLAEKRLQARANKQWDESDRLRTEIAGQGWMVQDSKEGYKLVRL